jgi:hypothetical protein
MLAGARQRCSPRNYPLPARHPWPVLQLDTDSGSSPELDSRGREHSPRLRRFIEVTPRIRDVACQRACVRRAVAFARCVRLVQQLYGCLVTLDARLCQQYLMHGLEQALQMTSTAPIIQCPIGSQPAFRIAFESTAKRPKKIAEQ